MNPTRIGISGWRYADWRGHFYPPGLPHHRELTYLGTQFDTVELNGSFYSLQAPSSYERWSADTRDDFMFSVKGGGFITHRLKLKNARSALANFFASGVLALEQKLGPILWQFPAQMHCDLERFASFFAMLPQSRSDAVALAQEHNDKLDGPPFLTPRIEGPIRHCVEVRHDSFASKQFIDLLQRHGIALVVAESAVYPMFQIVTAPFMYLRLHGSHELYKSRYSDEELETWARRIRTWSERGLDVFTYFDNTEKRQAPIDALRLRDLLHGRVHSEAWPEIVV